MPRRHVLVVGDLVTDVVAHAAEPLAPGSDTAARVRITGGGQAANTAAWLAWTGCPARLVAAVGADGAGRARVAELTAAGVDCAVATYADAATGAIVVLTTADERTMLTDRGANLRLSPADVDAGAQAGLGHVHLSAYPLLDPRSRPAGLRALALARAHSVTSSVDAASAAPLRRAGAPAFLGWVQGVDLLLVNAAEAAVLTGRKDPAEQAALLARQVRNAVVKLGAAGAVWRADGGAAYRVTAGRAEVVDPTGAGDAFAAGVLAAWLAGAAPVDALAAGARLGARAVRTVGSRPAEG
jgi:ribokinase